MGREERRMKHTEYIVPIGEEAKEFDEIFIGVLRKHKELIRCKDCKYSVDEYGDGDCYCDYDRNLSYIGKNWNHYCGFAERREE